MPAALQCSGELRVIALPQLPRIQPGADLPELIAASLARLPLAPAPGDVLVVTSKIISRAENRFVHLGSVEPSARASKLATQVAKDPRLVELILRESVAISRAAPGLLIVRHRLGFISANAAIDCSNACPEPAGAAPASWVLLLPVAPDASAARLREALEQRYQVRLGVILSDSHGRPFRRGSVGVAIGCAGLPALVDQRGLLDLDGQALEHTATAAADQIAAVADLVAGQAGEGRGAVLLRGLRFSPSPAGASSLLRPPDQDLYA